MARTNKERQQLKEQGYVYYRPLAQWMKPEEIEKHEQSQLLADQFSFIAMVLMVIGAFIFFLVEVGKRG